MKKTILYSAIALATLSMTTSCGDSFLEINPVGKVSEPNLVSVDGVDMVLTGAYATLYGPGRDKFAVPFANYAYGDVFGGDANKGSEAGDQPSFTEIETFSFNTANDYLRSKWRYLYDGIKAANNTMHMAELAKEALSATAGEKKDKYTEVVAQATFLRGLYHFETAKMFGAAVPYISLEAHESNVDPNVSNVDESGNYIYIWDKIAADFKYAYENLPEKWTTDFGRANKWAAAAFLAKTYMYWSSPYTGGENGTVDHWADAKSLIETILSDGCDSKGTKYKLADTYGELYQAGKSDWTGESIFDIQTAITGTQSVTSSTVGTAHIATAGVIDPGDGGWGFFQPSYYLANSYIVDDNGLPEEVKVGDKPLSTLGDKAITTDLSVYTDPRVDFSIGRFDVPFMGWGIPTEVGAWIRSTSNGGVYLSRKYLPTKDDKAKGLSLSTSSASSVKNIHIFRVADLYLLYAECCIHANDLATAREYINKVRARAANSCLLADESDTVYKDDKGNVTRIGARGKYKFDDLVNGQVYDGGLGVDGQVIGTAGNYRLGLWPAFANADEATKALRDERHIELALEGQRWFDLARWGIASPTLNGFIQFEQKNLPKYSGKTYDPKWICFPIPDDEIIIQKGVLVQNAAWK